MDEYILKCTNNKKLADSWIESKYKIKPLIIYGNPGTGKTTIAKYILKNRTIIHITSDKCKSSFNLDEFLKVSLYKKSITMMFSKENIYKAIIFDDLSIIQSSDKKLFKSIIQFSKKSNKKHPIIYIFNKINNKLINNIINNSFILNISYSKNNLLVIITKYLIDYKIDEKEILYLIEHSNYNLHNIITNIQFYKNNFNNIQKYENTNMEISEYINIIIETNKFSDIYRYSESDFNVINLILLENIHKFLNLKDKKNLIKLKEIYKYTCISDNILTKIHYSNDWSSINHNITFGILCPVLIIKPFYKNNIILEYTKYISKCIIYTYNNKLLNINYLNVNILSYLYYMINEYNKGTSINIIEYIKYYIKIYNISIQIATKFLKYFNIYNKIEKKDLNIFYKMI